MDEVTRQAKINGHPLRREILKRLRAGEASPASMARALNEPLGNVSYHIKILLELEAIRESRRRPVRGAIEHFYVVGEGAPQLLEAWICPVHGIIREEDLIQRMDGDAYVEEFFCATCWANADHGDNLKVEIHVAQLKKLAVVE